MDFKVGDKIIGNKINDYPITHSEVISTVYSLDSNDACDDLTEGNIVVMIDGRDEKFGVESRFFRLLNPLESILHWNKK